MKLPIVPTTLRMREAVERLHQAQKDRDAAERPGKFLGGHFEEKSPMLKTAPRREDTNKALIGNRDKTACRADVFTSKNN